MQYVKPRSLGILLLDRGQPPNAAPPTVAHAPMRNPDTFDFPTSYETVDGAYAENVIRGDPTLEPVCIDAARRLVEQGAVAISSNCGFFIRHQAAVAASVKVPVVMSALLMVPMLLRQLAPPAKLAIVTADSTQCSEDLFGGADTAIRGRVVLGGIEGGKLWQNEMKLPSIPTDVADIEADVTACVARLRAAHPETAAVLFECAGFPVVAPVIRQMTGLPVYDIATLCRMTFASIA
nr:MULTISPECIES: hypothetical protein [unclassified Mesorhizobium]